MPRYSRLKAASPSARRSCSRNSGAKKARASSAVALQPDPRLDRRSPTPSKTGRCGSRRSTAWQSALRATRAHRPQRRDQVVGKSRRLVRHDPAIHRQSADRIVAARQRQHPRAVVELEPIDIVALELAARLDDAPRVPAAPPRHSGVAPGRRPPRASRAETRRYGPSPRRRWWSCRTGAPSAPESTPRAARGEMSAARAPGQHQDLLHPQRRIDPISELTQVAHRRSPIRLGRSAP